MNIENKFRDLKMVAQRACYGIFNLRVYDGLRLLMHSVANSYITISLSQVIGLTRNTALSRKYVDKYSQL